MLRSEKELVSSFRSKSKPFLRELRRKLSNRYMFILEEFDSYNGIPDMVLGSFCSKIKSRLHYKPVDINWAAPLTRFKMGDTITSSDFASYFGVTSRKATQVLHQYLEAGYLNKKAPSTFVVIREYEIMADAIVSIEGKLKNWRRAIFQAQRYKRFSNLSFVLLEDTFSAPALKNIEKFKEANVGLITMKGNRPEIKFIPEWEDLKQSQYTARIHEAAFCSLLAKTTAC